MNILFLAALSYIEIMGIGLFIIVILALGFYVARYAKRSARDDKKLQAKMKELQKEIEYIKQQKRQ